jgi:carbon-monoxide dehydrogenase iron sulfur subunit
MTKKIYYDVNKCLACKSCEFACAIGHSNGKELLLYIKNKEKTKPAVKVHFSDNKNYPIACRSCQDHPCVGACIAVALSFDKKEGRVKHDKDRCVGCWMCVMVCPYGAIRPDKDSKIPVRCDLCEGEDEQRCVKACPTGAIFIEEEKEAKSK